MKILNDYSLAPEQTIIKFSLTEDDYLKEFKNTFGDIVPLRELPSSVSEVELIEAIKKSIEEKTNYLPEIFGYRLIEADSNKVI